jgi:ABC-type multidrug transport system permease subunit
MMDLLLTVIYDALCLCIIGASICRVLMLDPKKHSYFWAFVYMGFGTFALGELLHSIKELPRLEIAMAVVAIFYNLILTWRSWDKEPPLITRKQVRV